MEDEDTVMGSGHGHRHGYGYGGYGTVTGAHRGRLAVVLVLTICVLVVEVAGGLLSGSLALLADAGHMAADAAGLAIALAAASLARRPATDARTFGWQRVEILAAAVNAAVLFAVAGSILLEAARRLADPPEVGSGLMLTVALVGLVANAAGLWVLRRGQSVSLNVRGAYLEVLGDLLGSAAVVAAAVVIALTGFEQADVAASAAVAVMILPRAWGLLREAVDILLEATPRHVDLAEVRAHILAVPGVTGVHDLHAWTVTSGLPVLTAHVVVDDATADGVHTVVLDRLGACLAAHFDVEHCTFQVEPARHHGHEPVLHS